MKIVSLVLIFGVLAAAGFWYITENDRADRAENYRRQQEQLAKDEAREREKEEKQRAEDERIRKERAAALAKEDAVRLFLNYIDREEERLKDETAELKIKLEKVDVDQNSMTEELQAIERANAVRVASAEKRKEQQRDKIERVLALLRSPTLNRLSRTYCGEDLAALRSRFEGEVQKIKDVDDKYQKRFRDNLKRYEDAVVGADEAVNRKLKAARAKYEAVTKGMDSQRLPKLKAQLATVEREIARINGKKSQSKWDKRDVERLQQQQILLQNQIAQFEDVGGLAAADIAHMEATEAETEARRKFDTAGKALTLDNTVALAERDYEQDIYNLAMRYEEASLDKIREAMQRCRELRGLQLEQAEKKLAFLKKSSANVDFLNAQEVEEMRKKVVKTISEEMLEGGLK